MNINGAIEIATTTTKSTSVDYFARADEGDALSLSKRRLCKCSGGLCEAPLWGNRREHS